MPTGEILDEQMQADWQLARRLLVKIKAGQMSRANRNRQISNFKIGDLVMVLVYNVNRSQLTPKGSFADRWAGPYRVCGQCPMTLSVSSSR